MNRRLFISGGTMRRFLVARNVLRFFEETLGGKKGPS
jgi:hypothetical protein